MVAQARPHFGDFLVESGLHWPNMREGRACPVTMAWAVWLPAMQAIAITGLLMVDSTISGEETPVERRPEEGLLFWSVCCNLLHGELGARMGESREGLSLCIDALDPGLPSVGQSLAKGLDVVMDDVTRQPPVIVKSEARPPIPPDLVEAGEQYTAWSCLGFDFLGWLMQGLHDESKLLMLWGACSESVDTGH